MILELLALKELNKPVEIPQPKPVETTQVAEPEPEPKTHIVAKNDSLTKIAKANNVPLERLWAANPQIENQDKIDVGDTIIIPLETDILAPRAFVAPEPVSSPHKPQTGSRQAPVRSGAYEAGQCTAWVAEKRFVPSGWGNASNWRNAAQKAGWTVSSHPVDGAIGWRGNHVVYVESVNGDGTVTISEQNYNWVPFSVRTITRPANYYTYIY